MVKHTFAAWYAKSVSEAEFIAHHKKERPGIEEDVDLKAKYAELTGKKPLQLKAGKGDETKYLES